MEERSSHGRAGLSYEINENWSFENRLGYQDRDVGADMPSMFYLADTNYETFSYSPALHLNSNKVDFVFGMDFSKDELDAKTNYGDSSFERTTSAFYSSVGLPISDLWKFNGNLRVEKAEHSGICAKFRSIHVFDPSAQTGKSIANELVFENAACTPASVARAGSKVLAYKIAEKTNTT